MTETLEEQMAREAPRVNAELARRDAIKKTVTGIVMRYGAFYENGHGTKHGPIFEVVPGVWAEKGRGTDWHSNGVVLYSTLDDPRNLKIQVPA